MRLIRSAATLQPSASSTIRWISAKARGVAIPFWVVAIVFMASVPYVRSELEASPLLWRVLLSLEPLPAFSDQGSEGVYEVDDPLGDRVSRLQLTGFVDWRLIARWPWRLVEGWLIGRPPGRLSISWGLVRHSAPLRDRVGFSSPVGAEYQSVRFIA